MVVSSFTPIAGASRTELVSFAQKCSLISPLLLHLKSWSSEMIATATDIVKSSNSNCIVTDVPIDMDEEVMKLLDAGLVSALFTCPDGNADEVQLLKKVLGTFPANRVGVSVSNSFATQELLRNTLTLYGQECCSFTFRSRFCLLY